MWKYGSLIATKCQSWVRYTERIKKSSLIRYLGTEVSRDMSDLNNLLKMVLMKPRTQLCSFLSTWKTGYGNKNEFVMEEDGTDPLIPSVPKAAWLLSGRQQELSEMGYCRLRRFLLGSRRNSISLLRHSCKIGSAMPHLEDILYVPQLSLEMNSDLLVNTWSVPLFGRLDISERVLY